MSARDRPDASAPGGGATTNATNRSSAIGWRVAAMGTSAPATRRTERTPAEGPPYVVATAADGTTHILRISG